MSMMYNLLNTRHVQVYWKNITSKTVQKLEGNELHIEMTDILPLQSLASLLSKANVIKMHY